ncbi:DUF1737 domain-containing protein [Aquimarina algiphila]|uniref:DUF1737 domain-containing protein n=1 Tax=Aquimarina algiphila TaxID=2047982 RepID=UPI002330335E|nr:DUF1737 domain-containing protein [Aquimarina algiphila]
MEYKILSDQSEHKLEEKVNIFLEDGWKPTAGIFVLAYGGQLGVRYFQSIIKEELQPN